MATRRPREETIKVRLAETEKAKLTAYVAKLSPPRTLSAWLRDLIWKEARL